MHHSIYSDRQCIGEGIVGLVVPLVMEVNIHGSFVKHKIPVMPILNDGSQSVVAEQDA
jgi:hypothetical protein